MRFAPVCSAARVVSLPLDIVFDYSETSVKQTPSGPFQVSA